MKLDFRNAFNSVHRDKVLEDFQVLAPSVFIALCTQCIPHHVSSLYWINRTLSLSEGVQQGDPMGPLLFCWSRYRHSTPLSAKLCVEYLDDIVADCIEPDDDRRGTGT